MKTGNTQMVATFNELPPARELCGELERAGIESCVHDETKIEKFWFFTKPIAAIHVVVKVEDFVRTEKLLSEWGSHCAPMKEAIRCPECGSSRVEFPQITRKFLMPMAARFFMILHLMPQEFYCQNCQYTWPVQEPVRKVDNLNWPVDSHIGNPKTARKSA